MGLFEMVPNFSEGRRKDVVEGIVSSMTSVEGVKLLDEEMDPDHNRCVITLVGEGEPLVEAAFKGAKKAMELIDLNRHRGEHPRMGAMDVCPFVPLKGSTMEEAVALAVEAGKRIGEELEIPVFLYEEAARKPERKNLAKVRKGQFEELRELIGKDPERKPDFGPERIHPTAGAVAIGARFFLIAYNVNLETPELSIAKEIARKVRERDGGLPKVKALGFFLEDLGIAQVSMNLTNYKVTPIRKAFDAVRSEAEKRGVEVRESELIGLVPEDALDEETAKHILLSGFNPEEQILERKLAKVT